MKKINFTLETLTPLFLAGNDQNAVELRAASIRGHLRYWYRALLGGLDQEVTFEHPYYPHPPGTQVKVKVMAVTAEGKVTKVSPA